MDPRYSRWSVLCDLLGLATKVSVAFAEMFQSMRMTAYTEHEIEMQWRDACEFESDVLEDLDALG